MAGFYKLQFLTQLLVGEWLLLMRLGKRDRFPLRVGISIAALCVLSFILPAYDEGVVGTSAEYILIFACTLLAMRFCFSEPFQNLLLCGITGYTAQHLSYLIFTAINETLFSGVQDLGVAEIDPYNPDVTTAWGMDAVQTTLFFHINVVIYLSIYFIIYITVFDIYDPLIRSNHNIRLGNAALSGLSLLLILGDVVTNMVTSHYTAVLSVSWGLEIGYNILVCLMILAIAYIGLSGKAVSDELAAAQFLLEQGKRQYALSKENAELINIKYHDLRHQSERGAVMSQPEREELQKILSDFEARVETGNETLNIILTEMNALCRDAGTELLCMADGEGLDFVKPHHLYSLFTNAVENAVDAVKRLPENERVISLYLRRQGDMFHLHIENPCSRPPIFRDGLPVTDKEDKNYHGFGMLSMKAVAELYGGTLTASENDGLFALDIILVNANQDAFHAT